MLRYIITMVLLTLSLPAAAAEVCKSDWRDPYSGGFIVVYSKETNTAAVYNENRRPLEENIPCRFETNRAQCFRGPTQTGYYVIVTLNPNGHASTALVYEKEGNRDTGRGSFQQASETLRCLPLQNRLWQSFRSLF